MKAYLFLIISFILFSCATPQEDNRTEGVELDGYVQILEGEKCIQYLSQYMTLSDAQKSDIITIANEFQNDLQKMDSDTRLKNQGRYTIKYLSKIIRDVMTMEQAETFIKEDKAAKELFGE